MQALLNGLILVEEGDDIQKVMAAFESVTPEFIKAWRQAHRMTQDEMGVATDVTKQTISNYETGQKPISLVWKARFIKHMEANPPPQPVWNAPQIVFKRTEIAGTIYDQEACAHCHKPLVSTNKLRKVHPECRAAWKAANRKPRKRRVR